MASDITITSLTAVGGVGQIMVSVMASSPLGMSCLPYMEPAVIDIYMSTTNSFGSATKIGSVNSAVVVLAVGGIPAAATRYFWAIARDADDNESARYPAGNGISATTLTTVPPDGSITTPKLANGAVVPAKMSVGQLSAISGDFGSITAGNVTGVTFTGNIFRTAASGRRIEINASDNFMRAYNSTGQYVASFGEGGIDNAVVAVNRSSPSTNASFINAGNGNALATSGIVTFGGQGNRVCAWAAHVDIGSDAHGFRGQAGPGGGRGLVGVSAAGGGYGLYAEAGG